MRGIRKAKNQKGMTLVEILAVLGIMAIVAIPLSNLISDAYKTFYLERDKALAVNYAQDAVSRIVHDLRKNESLSTGIIESPTRTLVVHNGVDGNPKIEYRYDATAKKILYNGVSIFEEATGVLVSKFNFNQVSKDVNTNLDTNLIYLEVELERGKSGKVSANATYRRRY